MPAVNDAAKGSPSTKGSTSMITVDSTVTQETPGTFDDLASIMHLLVVSASDAEGEHGIDCTSRSLVTSGTAHGSRSFVLSQRGITTGGSNPSSTTSQATRGRSYNKIDAYARGCPFLAQYIFEKTMADLREALEGKNPRDSVSGLLEAHRVNIQDLKGTTIDLDGEKWRSIIEELCKFPGEAREVLDDPDFKSKLLMVVEQKLQHTPEAHQSGKEDETISLQERDAFGPLKPEERPTWNALAIVSNSLLGFLILSLVVLGVTLHLKRRRLRQAERERDRRYGEEERLERNPPSQEGTELRPMHPRGSAP